MYVPKYQMKNNRAKISLVYSIQEFRATKTPGKEIIRKKTPEILYGQQNRIVDVKRWGLDTKTPTAAWPSLSQLNPSQQHPYDASGAMYETTPPHLAPSYLYLSRHQPLLVPYFRILMLACASALRCRKRAGGSKAKAKANPKAKRAVSIGFGIVIGGEKGDQVRAPWRF